MKIVTWNVNSIRARLERVLPWLAEHRPDVVCLQETKCLDAAFPREPIEELGYSIETFGQKTYNGVAILSRGGIEDVTRGFGGELASRFDVEARVIAAQVGDFQVLNLYVVNGKEVGSDKYAHKLAWLAQCAEFIERRFALDEKLVVTGDFNVTFDDRDVYDPEQWRGKILCSEPEREALAGVMRAGQLVDALRHFTDEGEIYTWWDFRTRGFQRGNRGLRIDHFLVTEPALALCRGIDVDREERGRERPSDHAPVIATFD
ncbi:MAG: exodeoxyribonuclease III [Planctomycetota bacterium]